MTPARRHLSTEPTPTELRELLRNPNPDRDESYDAGIDLRHSDGSLQGGVQVVSTSGDIDVVVTAQSGRACSTVVAGLEPGEALELALALEHAARAANRYRERNGT